MMPFDQILGWIGNAGFFGGNLLIAKKHIGGWYLQLLANLLYILQSIILGNPSLLWLSIVLGSMNIFGIYMWRKK